MPLTEGQWQVRDLVMGPDTPYCIMPGTNPWGVSNRAPSQTDRTYANGAWSGAEWRNAKIVPINVGLNPGWPCAVVDGEVDVVAARAAWRKIESDLVAAFAAIEDSTVEVECRFVFGGFEYVMFGRPRLVEVLDDEWALRNGVATAQCAFVVLDGLIFSGDDACETTGLVQTTGGLVVRGDVPTTDNDLGGTPRRDWPPPSFVIPAERAGGEVVVTNEGNVDTCVVMTIEGPVDTPAIEVIHEDGTVDRMEVRVTLDAGQEMVIDTCANTITVNGFSQRRFVVGDWPTFPPGDSTVVFRAANYNPSAQMTVCSRSAWSG